MCMAIKIRNLYTVNYNNNFQGNSQEFKKYTEQGNTFLKTGRFDEAIAMLKKAHELDKKDKDTNLKLARAYTYKKQHKQAIPHFENYLAQSPEDLEIQTLLGISYRETGKYNDAKKKFNDVLEKDTDYDFARRSLLETENWQLGVFNPKKAFQERQATADKNLRLAFEQAQQYLPADYFSDLGDVSISFDTTAKMGGRSNIAQYEHQKRKISVTSDYIYASPNLVTSYLIHEFVHAKDNDPYTSIKEEQDAYRVQAEYWLKNSNNVKDPEMDYATSLYKQSPKALADRVAEIYKLRSPGISETSNGHIDARRIKSRKLSENPPKPVALDVIA